MFEAAVFWVFLDKCPRYLINCSSTNVFDIWLIVSRQMSSISNELFHPFHLFDLRGQWQTRNLPGGMEISVPFCCGARFASYPRRIVTDRTGWILQKLVSMPGQVRERITPLGGDYQLATHKRTREKRHIHNSPGFFSRMSGMQHVGPSDPSSSTYPWKQTNIAVPIGTSCVIDHLLMEGNVRVQCIEALKIEY